MTAELDLATGLLKDALDRYHVVCTRLRNESRHESGILFGNVSSEFTKRVVDEISRATLHEANIKYSRAILSQLHNFSESGTALSINRLPLEILTRIFEYATNMHTCPAVPCSLQKPPKDTFLKDPVIFSHVCSHWRRVVVNAATLWSHIDICPLEFRNSNVLARVDAYVTRSSRALVDVHIIEEIPHKSHYSEKAKTGAATGPTFTDILALIAPRMRSLTIYTKRGLSGADFVRTITKACFPRCTPGTLTEVSVCAAEQNTSTSASNLSHTDGLTAVPRQISEPVWLPVKVLRLEVLYPRWTSKAYHGLTELRLVQIGPITQSRLKAILQSSPQLRILKIDLNQRDFRVDDMSSTPVHLDDLEILILGSAQEEVNISLLPLIAPGPKSLSLSFINPYMGGLLQFKCKNELTKFAARSNITRLSTHDFDDYAQLAEVLSLLPAVRILAVNGISCHTIDEETALPQGMVFEELYVINSSQFGSFTWSSIEMFVEKHRVRKLTLWDYDFRYCEVSQGGKEIIPDNLYTICPVVNLVPNTYPNPIQEWF